MADSTCSIDGCDKPFLARGWCTMHYQRWRTHGDPGPAEPYRDPDARCSHRGCGEPHQARGWCDKHYRRWRNHGDPTVVKKTGPKPRPASERFWEKVDVGHPLGCWEWNAALGDDGYGRFSPSADRNSVAHRFAYELLVESVPDELDLDHLCRNRSCVNPDHLEPVTRRENLLRGPTITAENASRTHCPQGHPYRGDNVRVENDGSRTCRTCDRIRARQYRRRKARENT